MTFLVSPTFGRGLQWMVHHDSKVTMSPTAVLWWLRGDNLKRPFSSSKASGCWTINPYLHRMLVKKKKKEQKEDKPHAQVLDPFFSNGVWSRKEGNPFWIHLLCFCIVVQVSRPLQKRSHLISCSQEKEVGAHSPHGCIHMRCSLVVPHLLLI